MTVKILPEGPGSSPVPTTQTFTAHIDAGRNVLIAGLRGELGHAALVGASGTWKTTEPFTLSAGEANGPCTGTRLRYESMALIVEGDGVRGEASGVAETFMGDAIGNTSFTASLAGKRDLETPSLVLTSATKGVHPFDTVVVKASEPLPDSTGMHLQGADGTPLPFESNPEAGAVASFLFRRVLPWGGGFVVAPDAPPKDLAGNVAGTMKAIALQVLDLGFLDSPGFEGNPTVHVTGDAGVVGSDVVPPISGARSLYIPPGYGSGRFSARLKVPPGAKSVRAIFRGVSATGSPSGFGFYWLLARVGAPLGLPEVVSLPMPPEPWEDWNMLRLSAVTKLDVPLPAGTTDEVDIDVKYGSGGCGLLPPPLGLVLDDLRAE